MIQMGASAMLMEHGICTTNVSLLSQGHICHTESNQTTQLPLLLATNIGAMLPHRISIHGKTRRLQSLRSQKLKSSVGASSLTPTIHLASSLIKPMVL